MPLIALLTDFGTRDWFVASMKGATLGIAPSASIIDITHEIAAGEIRPAAFILRACFRDFPIGTIFVTVVDPGVGSSRRALGIQAGGYWFIGPDNGVLMPAVDLAGGQSIFSLENSAYFRPEVSSTFHGRDIFAPVAAHLAMGVDIKDMGPTLPDPVMHKIPRAKMVQGSVSGEVLYIDRFGNAVTNIDQGILAQMTGTLAVMIPSWSTLIQVVDYYQQVRPGEPLAIIGSTGQLEIALRGGNASVEMQLKPGAQVSVGLYC